MFVIPVELIFLLMQLSYISYFIYKLSRIRTELFFVLIPFNYAYTLLHTVSIVNFKVHLLLISLSFLWLVYALVKSSKLFNIFGIFMRARLEQETDDDGALYSGEDEEILGCYFFSPLEKKMIIGVSFIIQLFHFLCKLREINIEQTILLVLLLFVKFISIVYRKVAYIFNQRDFKNWQDLPPELRMMVIDRMKPKSRVRFSRCSKLCNKEAKQSKNYIFALELSTYESHACIDVKHLSEGYRQEGYIINFGKNIQERYVECRTLKISKNSYNASKELWRSEIDESSDIDQLAIQYFKNLLEMYQDKIKRLSINMTTIPPNSVDFGICSLRNLEELEIRDGTDVRKMIAKTRKTLKVLEVGKSNGANFEDFEQIYYIKQKFHSATTKLNKEQFLRLSASDVRINIGYLTPYDICSIIRSWQNGTFGREVKRLEWVITNSIFDVAIIFRCFGAEFHGNVSYKHEIMHHEKIETRALLHYFQVTSDNRLFSFEPIVEVQE